MTTRRKWVIGALTALAVLVLAAVVTSVAFAVLSKKVSGDSMVPTLHDGDRFLVAGDGGSAHRFDVVVAREPGGSNDIVKRVIAVPGDAVEIRGATPSSFTVLVQPGHRGRWYRVEAPTWPGRVGNPSPCCAATGRTSPQPTRSVVPPDDYFVMGDNPAVSLDSRSFGWVAGHDILGRVGLRVWPLSASRHVGNRPKLVPAGNLR